MTLQTEIIPMRYLKVIAQDQSQNGVADTVHFHFCEVTPGPNEDCVLFKASAFDMNGDGRIDQLCGDVNDDGKRNLRDQQLLKRFAKAYLKLNWNNPAGSLLRYMQIFAEDFTTDSTPEAVRLHFHEGVGSPVNHSMVYGATAYDVDNNGSLEWILAPDVDHDGRAGKSDEHQVKWLATEFLKFNWK